MCAIQKRLGGRKVGAKVRGWLREVFVVNVFELSNKSNTAFKNGSHKNSWALARAKSICPHLRLETEIPLAYNFVEKTWWQNKEKIDKNDIFFIRSTTTELRKNRTFVSRAKRLTNERHALTIAESHFPLARFAWPWQCMYLHVWVGLLSEAACQPSEHIIGGLLQNSAVINPSRMEKNVHKKTCRLVKQ